MPDEPHISIILPCYNAASVLPRSLERLFAYFEGQPHEAEILVVDDGSADGTRGMLQAVPRTSCDGGIRTLVHEVNRGKGSAVRDGMLAAGGRYRIFIDVDLDYPPSEIGKVLACLEAGADVAIASRMAPGSVLTMHPWHIPYLFTRHLASRMLNKVFRSFYVRGVLDSQAGLKGFTAAAAQAIFSRTTIDRFSSDMEVLYIARRLGFRIEQVPVNFTYGRQPSTVRFFRDSIHVVRDLVRIRVNAARGLYDGTHRSSGGDLKRRIPRCSTDPGGCASGPTSADEGGSR